MNDFDELDKKVQRQLIEDEIRRKSFDGNYEEVHKKMYDTFFSIFKNMSNEYRYEKENSKISIIEFIDKKNMLKEYYEIAKGNNSRVLTDYHDKLKKESEKLWNEHFEQEIEKSRQEKEIKKNRLLEKISNGQITKADNLDLIINGLEDYCITEKWSLETLE